MRTIAAAARVGGYICADARCKLRTLRGCEHIHREVETVEKLTGINRRYILTLVRYAKALALNHKVDKSEQLNYRKQTHGNMDIGIVEHTCIVVAAAAVVMYIRRKCWI